MDFTLEIREDNMAATILSLPTATIAANEIIKNINSVLETNLITHGIQKDNLMNTIAKALKKKVNIDKLIIAVGKMPVNGNDSRIKLNFNEELDEPEDLASKNPTIINQYSANFFWPNQVIAEEIPPTEGEDGYTIFGEVLKASPGKSSSFKHNETVTKSENQFLSNVAGIATYEENQLKITVPLYISQDKLKAQLIVFPIRETSGAPSQADIEELLSRHKICKGINQEVVNWILSDLSNETEPKIVVLAEGKPPTHGDDNKITANFDKNLFEVGPLIEEESESISGYANNFFKANQVIAEDIKATDGEDGYDVFGEIIKASPGKQVDFKHDDSVTKSEDKYIAKVAGIACLVENRLTVTPPIYIPEDNMAAHLVVLPITDSSRIPDASDIGSMLSWYNINKGVDRTVIAKVLQTIATTPELKRVIVAKGKGPEKGLDAGIEWKFNHEVTDLESLLSVLTPDNFIKIKDSVVMMNQPVAVETAASPGTAGYDVHGNEKPPQDVLEVHINPGDNVEKIENNFVASAYGICELKDSKINIIPLINIPEDKMEAELTLVSDGKEIIPKSFEELSSNLKELGITEGISLAKAKRAYRDGIGDNNILKMVIAKGTPPIIGHKAKILSKIDFSIKAGKISENGNIDYRERSFVHNVNPNDVVAVQTEAKLPIDGKDVFGEKVEAGWDEDEGITIGQNINKTKKNLYVAAIKGIVCLMANTIEVMEILEIKGDLDYSIGNLEVDGAVIIHGSVLSGFSITARGEVLIHEGVDNAQVHSMQNITVTRGIVGDKSKVVSESDVTAGFVNTGTVQAKGNIIIGDTIYNGHIRCNGILEATKKHGMITGGEVYATGGIKCKSIGNEAGTPTKVGILMDSEKYEALSAIKEKLKKAQDGILALHNKLGETALSDPKKAFEIAPPTKREELFKSFSNLSALLKVEKTLKEQEEKLNQKENTDGISARVQAQDCFPGTTIVFNDKELKIDENMKRVNFRKDKLEDKIVNG